MLSKMYGKKLWESLRVSRNLCQVSDCVFLTPLLPSFRMPCVLSLLSPLLPSFSLLPPSQLSSFQRDLPSQDRQRRMCHVQDLGWLLRLLAKLTKL